MFLGLLKPEIFGNEDKKVEGFVDVDVRVFFGNSRRTVSMSRHNWAYRYLGRRAKVLMKALSGWTGRGIGDRG